MNQEAIRKMRLAHKYQKEAMIELIPKEFRGNVMNIEIELKEIGQKWIAGSGMELIRAFMCEAPQTETKEQANQSSKIKKVNID